MPLEVWLPMKYTWGVPKSIISLLTNLTNHMKLATERLGHQKERTMHVECTTGLTCQQFTTLRHGRISYMQAARNSTRQKQEVMLQLVSVQIYIPTMYSTYRLAH